MGFGLQNSHTQEMEYHTYVLTMITKVFLFNDTEGNYLKFTVTGLNSNVIYHVNIISGICFEVDNETYFTYANQIHSRVFVFNFSSKASTQ